MKETGFAEAIEGSLAQAMGHEPRIIIMGEDVQGLRLNLLARFGEKRIRNTPISESAFIGAAVSAAMAGLRPVVEVMKVDFMGVAMDALLNHAVKVLKLSGGKWKTPVVIRAACEGGYGDGGQHEQSLWGWLAHIPGLVIVVPCNPADAGGLMLAAIEYEGPVIYLEHKLRSDYWLDAVGAGGRETVHYDVPAEGSHGLVPNVWEPVPLAQAATRRDGDDLTLISVGVGVHRSLEAAQILEKDGFLVGVIDIKTVTPIDKSTLVKAVTEAMVVVDEDYEAFGLSGELAAIMLEAGIQVKYGRVCTRDTKPYSRHLENETLPNTQRIVKTALKVMNE